jgi:hypothetical protein
VISENVQTGTITLNIYFDSTSAVALQPSKPHLGFYHPGEGPIQYGWIYLGWGADFFDGYPIEPDINWSELQRKIGTGSWQIVYSGPNRVWSDNSLTYDPNGDTPVYFRVRWRDSQNKWSLWSNIYSTRMMKYAQKSTDENFAEQKPLIYALSQNFPNPFNPLTTINYEIPKSGFVQLKIYDLLGREIAILVNETKTEGRYTEIFDASNLPSGVYIYSLIVNEFIQNNKMTLLK